VWNTENNSHSLQDTTFVLLMCGVVNDLHCSITIKTMDDELIRVKGKILETEGELAIARTNKDRELVLSLTNLLVALYKEKELLRLSAGKIYCNRGFYDITCGFYPYIFQGGAVGGGRQGKLLLAISSNRPILTQLIIPPPFRDMSSDN
jgi:hypothetical protein